MFPRSARRRTAARRAASAKRSRRLHVESLEPRQLLAAVPEIASVQRDRSEPGFHFALSGHGAAGQSIAIEQLGRGEVGRTSVAPDGTWSYTVRNTQLAQGTFQFVATNPDGASSEVTFRPNLVLINLDDVRADEVAFLPFVRGQLASSGTVFPNSFVPTALSGPSRASLLTGQYAHHTGVFGNYEPLGGHTNYDMASTIATWLDDVGYQTGYFGKTCISADPGFEFTKRDPKPGWDEYHDKTGGGYYYDWIQTSNGVVTRFGSDPQDYSTDVYARMAKQFIRNSAAGSDPFFLYWAPTSSHAPFTPAVRHAGDFAGFEFERPPSYGVVPDDIPSRAPFKPGTFTSDEDRRRHLEALQSADDGVEGIVRALQEAGEWDNTVLIFTTDHGYLWGEHALAAKQTFHEEAIRVPLIVVDGRTTLAGENNQLALNIDLAPTLAELAGTRPSTHVDGKSLVDTLYTSNKHVRSDFLLEHQWDIKARGAVTMREGLGTRYVGVRTQQWKYIEYGSGHIALYNLKQDPYEMRNIAGRGDVALIQERLAARVEQLRSADRQGPAVSHLSARWEAGADGLPMLLLTGRTTDATTGGSEVRSPEIFLDGPGDDTGGIPVESADGIFDSVAEGFRRKIPHEAIARLGAGEHRLFVHGRDTAGNWGPYRSVSFVLAGAPALIPSSDTGVSSSDGRTVDWTPTFRGVAAAGSEVELFLVANSQDAPISQGVVTANSLGRWNKTLNLLSGEYHVFAVATHPVSLVRTVSAGAFLQIVARIEDGTLEVGGTSHFDDFLLDATQRQGWITIFSQGIKAGQVPVQRQVIVRLGAANDRVIVQGTLNTLLEGGEGNDVLIGGNGNDTLSGGLGVNQLRGGPGSDRYLFETAAAVIDGSLPIFDTVSELPGEGNDLLDFGSIGDRVFVDFRSKQFATYDMTLPFPSQRRVALANLSADRFEQVRLGLRGGTVWAPSHVLITAAGGNRLVTATNRVQAGSQVSIKALSAVPSPDSDLVVLFLTASHGTLSVPTNIGGGLSASNVTGNGTGTVRLTGSVARINKTLHSLNGLRYTASQSFEGFVQIESRQLTEPGGSLKSRGSLIIRTVAAPTGEQAMYQDRAVLEWLIASQDDEVRRRQS